jgi:uncharacterized protein (DUF1015 family)
VAQVLPFRGLRYHSRYAGELARLTTPPYDVIGAQEKAEYEKSHPRNIIRLILPGEAGNPEDGTFYSGAAALLDRWRRDETLVRDPQPAFYPYRQTYRSPDDAPASRFGFLGALELPQPGQTGALPHEKTLQAPREDRTRLMLACRANLSPIFLLHPDETGEVGSILGRTTRRQPLLEMTDRRGVRHELWKLEDPREIGRIRLGMAADWTLIADGHHRYESALAVRRELPDVEGARFVLAFFCSPKDEGFRIFPIHRLVRPTEKTDADRIGQRLEGEFPSQRCPEGSGVDELLAALKADRPGSFGVVLRGRPPFVIRIPVTQGKDGAEEQVENLDPVLLEREIFFRLLGISPSAVAGGAVAFTPDARDALRQVETGEAAAAFLLRPLDVKAVIEAARAGLRLPQKSTYFYPKLLTGLVLRPF